MPSRRTADLLAVKELDNSTKAVAVAEERVEAARRAAVERASRLRGRRLALTPGTLRCAQVRRRLHKLLDIVCYSILGQARRWLDELSTREMTPRCGVSRLDAPVIDASVMYTCSKAARHSCDRLCTNCPSADSSLYGMGPKFTLLFLSGIGAFLALNRPFPPLCGRKKSSHSPAARSFLLAKRGPNHVHWITLTADRA